MNIAVIGAGSWGTALACILNKNSHNVTLYCTRPEKAEKMKLTRHLDVLGDVVIDENIKITSDIEDVRGSEAAVIASASKYVRQTCRKLKDIFNNGELIINVAKGIEEGSLLRLSQVIQQELPKCRIAVLSGPSHAEELSRGLPTTCVAASEDLQTAKQVQDIFMNPIFRIYTNEDIIGVEIGGAFKNLIALAAGASDGIGYGDNTKAALITRGLAEITRLGVAMGAKEETFSGLSGIGDLIVTCTSMHSRNRRAGILLGQGKSLDEALGEVKMVVEGVVSAKAAYELSVKYNVDMPITKAINAVLFGGVNVKDAVNALMTRSKTGEKRQ